MGLSGGSKRTESSLNAAARPVYGNEIGGAYGVLSKAYTDNQPRVQGIQSQLQGLLGTAVGNYNKNPVLNASKSYVTSTLDQPYSSSEFLDPMIALSGRNIANQTTTALGTRGLTGGSQVAKILAGQLADNETGLRYQDYSNWQARQAQAAGMAPSLTGADSANLSSVLGLADQSANLGTDNASRFAQSVGGLLGPYVNTTSNQKTTEKETGSLLSTIGQVASIATMLSDKHAKENIRRVGQTDGGLPVYTYNYKGDATPQMGVMAQDVAVMQPEALGPEMGGFKTVRYGLVS